MTMQTITPPPTSASPSRAKAEVFTALMKDRRISHGAFRLWHLIYSFSNSRTGMSFPGRRLLQQCLGCCHDSLPRWTQELVTNGWLSLTSKAAKRGHRFIYELRDGTGQVFLKSGPLSRSAKWSRNQDQSGPESRTAVVLKAGSELIEPSHRDGSSKRNNPKRPAARQPVPACAGPAGGIQPSSSGQAGDQMDP